MRPGRDVYSVLQEGVGGGQLFTRLDRAGHVMEAAAGAIVVGGQRESVALVPRRHRGPGFIAVVEDDSLSRSPAHDTLNNAIAARGFYARSIHEFVLGRVERHARPHECVAGTIQFDIPF